MADENWPGNVLLTIPKIEKTLLMKIFIELQQVIALKLIRFVIFDSKYFIFFLSCFSSKKSELMKKKSL